MFPRQQQVLGLHDPVDPLVIDRHQIFRPQLAVQDRGDAAVAIGGPGRPQRGDPRHGGQFISNLAACGGAMNPWPAVRLEPLKF